MNVAESICLTIKRTRGGCFMFPFELRFQNLTIQEYYLKDGDIRFVGRDPYSHIVVDGSDVARNHAVVARS